MDRRLLVGGGFGLGFRGFKVGAGYYDGAQRAEVPASSLDEIVEMEAAKAELLRAHVGPDVAVLFDGHMGNPQGICPEVFRKPSAPLCAPMLLICNIQRIGG